MSYATAHISKNKHISHRPSFRSRTAEDDCLRIVARAANRSLCTCRTSRARLSTSSALRRKNVLRFAANVSAAT